MDLHGKRKSGNSRLVLRRTFSWVASFSNLRGSVPVIKTALVKSKFVEAIQRYQQVEQQYRQKYKQRMERQFKIGATPSGTLFVSVHLRRGSFFQSSPTRRQRKFVLSSMIAKVDRYSLKLCDSFFLFVN